MSGTITGLTVGQQYYCALTVGLLGYANTLTLPTASFPEQIEFSGDNAIGFLLNATGTEIQPFLMARTTENYFDALLPTVGPVNTFGIKAVPSASGNDHRLAVAGYLGGGITIFNMDLTSPNYGYPIITIDSPNSYYDVAWSPDGTIVYGLNGTTNKIHSFYAATAVSIAQSPAALITSPLYLAISHDGTTLCVLGNGTPNVFTFVNTSTLATTTSYTNPGSSPQASFCRPSWESDNVHCWVSDNHSGTVHRLDASTGGSYTFTPAFSGVYICVVSNQGGMLWLGGSGGGAYYDISPLAAAYGYYLTQSSGSGTHPISVIGITSDGFVYQVITNGGVVTLVNAFGGMTYLGPNGSTFNTIGLGARIDFWGAH
jgi:streptogramin lyase